MVNAITAMALVEIMVLGAFHLTGVVIGYYFSDRTNAKFIQEMYKQKNLIDPKEKVGLREKFKNLW